MKKDSKIVVKNNHLHHANKVGYFQFMGGPNHDVVVCCESPSCIKDGRVKFCFVLERMISKSANNELGSICIMANGEYHEK